MSFFEDCLCFQSEKKVIADEIDIILHKTQIDGRK
jgi:hypothetical protein